MVIDHLEPGGAQRQFCLLATCLRRADYDIEVFTLRPDRFFEFLLAGSPPIRVCRSEARTRVGLYFALRRWLRRYAPAVVVSFLSWPNLLVELSGIPYRRFAIIVSERNTDTSSPSARRRLRYFFHRLADCIVSNSNAQSQVMAGIDRSLKSRTTVITNAVDTDYFEPATCGRAPRRESIRMLVLARVAPQKNPLRLIEAISVLRSRRPDLVVYVDWYGKLPEPALDVTRRWDQAAIQRALTYYETVKAAISARRLEDRFQIHAAVEDVRPLYREADVLCLPSVYEGYPNVVAEAMASGVPVLASAVGDTDRLVDHGRSGFLFDPLSVQDIADTLVRFSELSDRERHNLGTAGRQIAETLLSVDVYASRYIQLIRQLTSHRTPA